MGVGNLVFVLDKTLFASRQDHLVRGQIDESSMTTMKHFHSSGRIKAGKLIFLKNQQHLIFPQVLCSAVAVVQHYLHTAVFTWMLVEGLNLYYKLVKIFDIKRPYAFYSAIGWGKG